MASSSSTPRPPPAPHPSLNRGESQAGRGTGQHSTPPPPPSPTWAEVVGGGSSRKGSTGSNQTHARPPAPSSRTPARATYTNTDTGYAPLHLPSAHSQYMAWTRCRREGVQARLVLETDGTSEEVSLWFRSAANGGDPAADTRTKQSGKRRREWARRGRRREERRRVDEERCLPPAVPTLGEAALMADIPTPLFPHLDTPPTTTTGTSLPETTEPAFTGTTLP